MIAVDSTYYLTTYLGVDPGSELSRLLARASDDVDIACPGGIDETTLVDADVTRVKKAVCAQVEFYVANGDLFNEVTGILERIGSFERSNIARSGQAKSPAALCPRALAYLEQTGLMFRGVGMVVHR